MYSLNSFLVLKIIGKNIIFEAKIDYFVITEDNTGVHFNTVLEKRLTSRWNNCNWGKSWIELIELR